MIVPSILTSSYKEIQNITDKLKGYVSDIQVDFVDGKFASTSTWPFTEGDDIFTQMELLADFSSQFKLEVDCMVSAPEQYLEVLANASVDKIIIHYGSTNNWDAIYESKKRFGYKLGLGVMNNVDLDNIKDLVPNVDCVQVMGIDEIGKQGQPFADRTLGTVRSLRDSWPTLQIAADGGVNSRTIPLLKEAGVNRFAVGSAIVKSDDPVKSYNELNLLI